MALVCARARERERKREKECVCVCVRERERERERECFCVCERERKRVFLCVREGEPTLERCSPLLPTHTHIFDIKAYYIF